MLLLLLAFTEACLHAFIWRFFFFLVILRGDCEEKGGGGAGPARGRRCGARRRKCRARRRRAYWMRCVLSTSLLKRYRFCSLSPVAGLQREPQALQDSFGFQILGVCWVTKDQFIHVETIKKHVSHNMGTLTLGCMTDWLGSLTFWGLFWPQFISYGNWSNRVVRVAISLSWRVDIIWHFTYS